MEVLFGLLLTMAVMVVVLAAKRGAEAAQRERHASLREVPARPMSAAGPVGARAPASSILSPAAPEREGRLDSALPAAAVTGRNGEPRRTPPTVGRSQPVGAADVGVTAAPPDASSPATEAPRRRRSEPDSWWDTSARPANRAPSRPAARRELPPIDLNTATAEELQGLPGVGVRAANRIVDHRARHGPFDSVGGLEAVEGFDHHRVARLATRATV